MQEENITKEIAHGKLHTYNCSKQFEQSMLQEENLTKEIAHGILHTNNCSKQIEQRNKKNE